MCHHILNVQCAFQAPCCRRWFDCTWCHAELSDHPLASGATELAFVCKTCRKPFRKDLTRLGPEDERCPHCGNELVRPAEAPGLRPTPTLTRTTPTPTPTIDDDDDASRATGAAATTAKRTQATAAAT